jgi:acyl dehydratase
MPLDLSLVGKPTEFEAMTYDFKTVVLYALGIGAKKDELDFLYEGRGPKVIPSFAVVPKFKPMLDLLGRSGGDLSMVVHGGERVRIERPFAPNATVKTRATVRGIYDMKKFATVLIDTETVDESGSLLAKTTSSILFRGAGSFGGEPPPKDEGKITAPKGKEPDFVVEETTSPEQALLYRLSGDLNPLHADPAFAEKVGFAQGPILHGLSTFGFMVRHVAKGVAGGDATRLVEFEAQFRRPVWPGETLVTKGYVVEPGKVALQVSVKERDEAVLGGAWAAFA